MAQEVKETKIRKKHFETKEERRNEVEELNDDEEIEHLSDYYSFEYECPCATCIVVGEEFT